MRRFSVRPALTFKGRKFKGLRGWAGKPFHPPLTDVPVAAYLLGAAFDVISFIQGGGRASGGSSGTPAPTSSSAARSFRCWPR